MKSLILGCGYVGVALGAELARRGHEVFGVRRSCSGESELRSVGIAPVLADVCHPASLENLPRDCDWVVFCASASATSVDEYRRTYVTGMRNAALWPGFGSVQKFVYTSSTGVYGQNDGSQVDETSATAPESATAKVLVEAEHQLLDAWRENALLATVLRVAGIYGPGRGFWLKQFLAGEAVLEAGGARFLNMVHRDDVVEAIITTLGRGQPGQVYNVVDDEPVTQLEMYQWLSVTLGRPLPGNAPQGTSTRTREATNKRVSSRRLRIELGCQLTYPTFREGFTAELHSLKRQNH